MSTPGPTQHQLRRQNQTTRAPNPKERSGFENQPDQRDTRSAQGAEKSGNDPKRSDQKKEPRQASFEDQGVKPLKEEPHEFDDRLEGNIDVERDQKDDRRR